MKPTPTQFWILRELNKPDGRAHLLRPDGSAFISNKTLSAKTVRADSLFALQDAGMIEDTERPEMRWRSSTYRITSTGKTALRDHDCKQRKQVKAKRQ